MYVHVDNELRMRIIISNHRVHCTSIRHACALYMYGHYGEWRLCVKGKNQDHGFPSPGPTLFVHCSSDVLRYALVVKNVVTFRGFNIVLTQSQQLEWRFANLYATCIYMYSVLKCRSIDAKMEVTNIAACSLHFFLQSHCSQSRYKTIIC